MPLRIGGKVGPTSGDPVDLEVTVRAIRTDTTQSIGEATMPIGTAVWLEVDGVHLLINDERTQTFHPEAFTSMGMDLSTMRLVIVKSTQHFYAGFEPIASKVIHAASPGALDVNFANIPYRHRSGNYWPRVDDPFATDGRNPKTAGG